MCAWSLNTHALACEDVAVGAQDLHAVEAAVPRELNGIVCEKLAQFCTLLVDDQNTRGAYAVIAAKCVSVRFRSKASTRWSPQENSLVGGDSPARVRVEEPGLPLLSGAVNAMSPGFF